MIRPSRDAVLAYPDLAERLTSELDYKDPGQWNGFVPPEQFNGSHNASTRRIALVAIVSEAHARDLDRTAAAS